MGEAEFLNTSETDFSGTSDAGVTVVTSISVSDRLSGSDDTSRPEDAAIICGLSSKNLNPAAAPAKGSRCSVSPERGSPFIWMKKPGASSLRTPKTGCSSASPVSTHLSSSPL